MDISNYIASGVLELYVNDLLSEREKREVEAVAAQYPDIKKEIANIEAALEAYAIQHRRAPKRNLKQAILDKIDQEENKDKPAAKVIQMATNQRYAIAATVIGLLLSGALNLVLYKNLTASQDEVIALMSEKSTVVENNNVLKASYEEKINTLAAPNTKVVALAGLPLAPKAKINVYWNSKNQQTYLRIENLPEAPSDKQYQLWALADGKPIDAGVFDSAEGILQQMKNIGAAQAFAITLEQKGGSPTPTLELMYAMGKI